MTIDISKEVYLTTKEIIDYAEKHNLDATEVWSQVIQKFVDLVADEKEGRFCATSDYSEDWYTFTHVGVREVGGTSHHNTLGCFGEEATQITLDQLLPTEVPEEEEPFHLEVGEIYKSGEDHYVKIISKVDGLTFKPFVGVKCTEQGHPLAYVGLYDVHGDPVSDNNKECRHYLEPIPKEHPNVAKIKELEEQINKLKEEMK